MSTPTNDRNAQHQPRDDTQERRTDVVETTTSRHDVVEREVYQFGGIKFGSAFFGWLTATGMSLLLTSLVAITGTALGLALQADGDAETTLTGDMPQIIAAVVLLVVLFVSYYCGGYVAGRMARFNGARQGFAVWLWAVVIAIVVAIAGAVAGPAFNILAKNNSFPRIPINEGDLTTIGITTAVIAGVVSLAGAVLGGAAGMRFHRRVDRAGFGE